MAVKSAYLTPEELDYLQELIFAADETHDAAAERPRQLLLSPYGGDTELLLQLLKAERLQLRLERGTYLFLFELYAERATAESTVALRFSYPTIIERYGIERAARVQPEQGDIQVVDNQGLLQAPQVRDISVTGLSLTDLPSNLTRAEHHPIDLRLHLTDAERLELKGRVVRINRDENDAKRRTVGIRFENIDAETQAILNRYIFRHHAETRH